VKPKNQEKAPNRKRGEGKKGTGEKVGGRGKRPQATRILRWGKKRGHLAAREEGTPICPKKIHSKNIPLLPPRER